MLASAPPIKKCRLQNSRLESYNNNLICNSLKIDEAKHTENETRSSTAYRLTGTIGDKRKGRGRKKGRGEEGGGCSVLLPPPPPLNTSLMVRSFSFLLAAEPYSVRRATGLLVFLYYSGATSLNKAFTNLFTD